MTNFIIIIGCIYLIYYAGNIVYDLFLTKDNTNHNNDSGQIINMGSITDHNHSMEIQNIQVDDVEHVTSPSSFHSEEDDLFNAGGESPDRDALKKVFEEEQSFDGYLSNEEQEEQGKSVFQEEQQDLHKAKAIFKLPFNLSSENIVSQTKEFISNSESELNSKWDNFLQKANTCVILTDNIDGHKVFKSTL